MSYANALTAAPVTWRPICRRVVMSLLLVASGAVSADDRIHLVINNQASQPIQVTTSSTHVVPGPDDVVVPGYFNNNDCTSPDLPTTVQPGTSVDVCSTLIDSGAGATIGIWSVNGVYQGQTTNILFAQIEDPPIGPVVCNSGCQLSDQGSGEYNLTVTWTDAAGSSKNWPPKVPVAILGPKMKVEKVRCTAKGKTIRGTQQGNNAFSCEALKTKPGETVRIVTLGKASQ